ncbi:MAG: polymorphic toxin-type HINT domain-containing protein, partial [Fimbriiglobus sp.]
SRSEYDIHGPVTARRVVSVIRRTAAVLTVAAGGTEIGTTAEHPFWVVGKGWTKARELAAGDRLVGHDGTETRVERVEDTGRFEVVYNLEVDEDHTYFVGADGWGRSVWAHNARRCGPDLGDQNLAPAASSKPEWLRRLDAGNDFNRAQAGRYPHNEIYVARPDGEGYYRLDSYNPRTGEIISRKYTQLSDVTEATGVAYINELANKYPPGTVIADVPSSGTLAGQRLRGQMILEVPVQTTPIPRTVLDVATQKRIVIRDINGKVY